MMFILDEIECAVENVKMFVEEKVSRASCMIDEAKWKKYEKESKAEPEDGVQQIADECKAPDDFDEYLRECARSVLFPCGVPESIRKEQEEEKRRAEEAAKPEEKETPVKNLKIEGAETLFTEETKGIFEALKNLMIRSFPMKKGNRSLVPLRVNH